MKLAYGRREAIVAGLCGLAVAAVVWGPVLLRPFSELQTVDLRTLHFSDGRLAVHAGSSSPARVTKAGPGSRVDINHADAAVLQTLPGIGPTLAQRIIAHRKAYGPFADIRGLLEVDGIGSKRFDRIESWIEAH